MTDETPNPTTPEPPAPIPGPSSRRPASSVDARPRRPDYRGEELDPERGPGLGCFWFQAIVLGFFIVLIPIGLKLNWPFEVLAILLFVVLGLLLLTGQTVIFLLRLVAADRRAQGRRRPLASPTKTVGELGDEPRVAHAVGGARPVEADVPAAAEPATDDDVPAAADPPTDVPAAADAAADAGADVPAAAYPAVASQAMIRDLKVFGTPEAGVPDPASEGASAREGNATGPDAGAGAPARTPEGSAALAGDAAGEDEGPTPPRTHESSPGGRRVGPAGTDLPAATDVPAEEEPTADAGDAVATADDAIELAAEAAEPAAADHDDHFDPGEPGEEPGPGVRQ